MKLYFAQLEENREPFIDLFGDVSDDVIAWLMFLTAKRFITKKNFTIDNALNLMSYHLGLMDSYVENIQKQTFREGVEKIESYFTKPRWSKPADVVIHDVIVDRPRNGLIVKWDYTDKFKERQKKRNERRDQKLKEELEAIQKGGKKKKK